MKNRFASEYSWSNLLLIDLIILIKLALVLRKKYIPLLYEVNGEDKISTCRALHFSSYTYIYAQVITISDFNINTLAVNLIWISTVTLSIHYVIGDNPLTNFFSKVYVK